MSKILVDTIDTRSGTTTLTLGTTNATTLDFDTGITSVTNLPSGFANKYPFKAILSGTQTGLTHDAFTKVNLASEDFDPNSKFDTTNYRYVPAETGYYSLTGSIGLEQGGNNLRRAGIAIYKNGNTLAFNWLRLVDGNDIISEYYVNINVVDYSSSTSDYYELFAYQNNSAGNNNAQLTSSTTRTYFTGFKLVR